MRFRVYRLKPPAREAFRWSPHTGGHAVVKQKDYETAEEVDAASEYTAWKLLNERGDPLFPGDVLELISDPGVNGHLRILKYIGFEPASWWVPVQKTVGDQDNGLNSVPNTGEISTAL